MTDNETITALKYKMTNYCDKCEVRSTHNCDFCIFGYVKQALDLINRKNAEIERLNNELHAKVEYIHEQRDVINEKKAEIEKLQRQVKRLKKYDEERDIALHAKLIATARAEAYKEFAERSKGGVEE